MSAETDKLPDKDKLRALPSIDRLLLGFGSTVEKYGHMATTVALREVIQNRRERIIAGHPSSTDEDSIRQAAERILETRAPPETRPVFNLTGTVLHTNLGRAILPEEAIAAIKSAAMDYSNLELNLTTGKRGDRESHVESLLCELTGAEAATFVNNNAAAVLLVLNTLAMNGEVPVSRGELVEIGGSFRIPEVMQRANCKLIEVGATNRTHVNDFRSAINVQTALLMKVHTSNYKIEGFTKDVSVPELAKLAVEFELPFVMDLGSGSLVDFARFGLPQEPTAAQVLSQGADIITFSGDKLLGGPQCGLIAGRADLIARLKSNPLKRALRLDKMTLAGLTEVLKLYRNPDTLAQALPTFRHLTRSVEEIRSQAERIAPSLAKAVGERFCVEVRDTTSQIGSGSLPTETISSIAIGIRSTNAGEDITQSVATAFRSLPTPVIGHTEKGSFMLDLRCLDDEARFVAQLGSLQV
ncbi:MAG: L-seryl-tRNA(Sec) selenium transferase [Woeseiaceae bacterium]